MCGFANPITNGPAGVVNVFSGASHNNELGSTNPEFKVLATRQSGPSSFGYPPHGAGEVVLRLLPVDLIHEPS
jgi:hypothetical protein